MSGDLLRLSLPIFFFFFFFLQSEKILHFILTSIILVQAKRK